MADTSEFTPASDRIEGAKAIAAFYGITTRQARWRIDRNMIPHTREGERIFNWALDGAQRLRVRGHFVQPDASKEAVREMEELGSPISAFVREKCELGSPHETVCNLLYMDWQQWCTENGRKATNTQVFGKDLRAAFPGIRITQPRDDEGGRFRSYQGIGRKS